MQGSSHAAQLCLCLCLAVVLLPVRGSLEVQLLDTHDVTTAQLATQDQGRAVSAASVAGAASNASSPTVSSTAGADIAFKATGYSQRRHGYADVLRYLRYLSRHPSKKDDAGLQHVTAAVDTKIHAVQMQVRQARKNMHHSKMMLQQLTEEKEGLESPDVYKRADDVGKLAIKEKLRRISSAIMHEMKAQKLWTSKLSPNLDQLSSLKAKRKAQRVSFAKKLAQRQAARLKRWAREKVDFNTWRATHTGVENKRYLRWKLTHKLKEKERAQKSNMERIRSKLESNLQKKLHKQMLSIRAQVAAAEKNPGKQILEKIQMLADKREFKRTSETKLHEAEKLRRLSKSLHEDQSRATRLKAEASAAKYSHRKKMENSLAKQQRLNGLAMAGLLNGKAKSVGKPHKSVEMLDDDTNGAYWVHKSKNEDPKVLAEKARALDAKVARATADDLGLEKSRRLRLASLTKDVLQKEHEALKLSGIRLRATEKSKKIDAIKRIHKLNKRLSKLQSTDAAEKQKSKAEMKAHDEKIAVAKEEYKIMKAKADKTKMKMKAKKVSSSSKSPAASLSSQAKNTAAKKTP